LSKLAFAVTTTVCMMYKMHLANMFFSVHFFIRTRGSF